MQNRNGSNEKMGRDEFLQKAETQLWLLKERLAKLHSNPCMYAVDAMTVMSMTELQREEKLAELRAAVSRAEMLVRDAEQERSRLWEQVDEARAEDRDLPWLVELKLLREDLQEYTDTLNFVRSRP